MLRLLRVRNFALIDELTLEFHPGLNVLSGETGAGKSLIVDAVGLIAGARASGETIRSGEDRAVIEAVADVGEAEIDAETLGLDLPEPGEPLVLRREISADGRNRVFINNQPATVSALRTIASSLLEIHGQHEQQTLLSVDRQLGLIDRAALTGDLRSRIGRIHDRLREAQQTLTGLDANESNWLQRQDLLEFQKTEIEAVHPEPGETPRLRQEARTLEHAGRLMETAGGAYDALYESDSSILAHLATLRRVLESETAHDPRLGAIAELLVSGRATLEEAAWQLREYLSHLDVDPPTLERLQTRLTELERLERKYGPDLPDHLVKVRQELDSIGLRADRRSSVIEELERLRAEYSREAGELSRRRREVGTSLAAQVTQELRTLAMPSARFSIEWETLGEGGRTGIDRPVWLLAANPGENPGPLASIASGGELSRTMLAVRSVLTANSAGRVLVFDEIDAGIGGEAAERVGGKLRDLAQSAQVLCVTHLSQIARFADHQAHIEKKVRSGRTRTEVRWLEGDARIEELARMMSGKKVTAAARQHVREILDRS